MDCTKKEIIVTDKIAFVAGVPDLFALRIHSLEHLDSWSNIPLDVNLEGDAFANGDDDEDHSADAIINYDCIAWE